MRLGLEKDSRRVWVVFLALTLLALVIRLAWLDRKSLWLDELFTLNHSLSSVEQITESLGDSSHPPLYYIGMHYWLVLGQSESVLRLPSALCGAISVGLLYLLGRRWAGEWTGIVSAILLAIAPIHAWFSQEARMYAIACALGLLAIWALTKAVTTGRWTAWLIWLLATVSGLYISYGTLALLAIELVLLLPATRLAGVSARRVLPTMLVLAGMVALYGPWLPTLVDHLALGAPTWYFASVSRALAAIGVPLNSRQLLYMFLGFGSIGVIVLGLVSWRLVGRLKERSVSFGVVGVSLMVVLYAIALVGSIWPVGYGVRRQVLIFFPFFLLAVAWGIARTRWKYRLFVGLIIITLPFLIANLAVIQQEDWRALAKLIVERERAQDIVLLSAPYYDQALEYYYQGPVDRIGVSASDVPDGLQEFTRGHERVWLILCGDVYTDPQSQIPSWLNTQRSLLERYTFANIKVQLYGPPRDGITP